jgi:hypothetical protein
VIPRRSASRAEPESPRALLPRAAPFKWARGTWETRRPKERSKGERGPILRSRPTRQGLRRAVLPLGSLEHLLSPVMRARRDGGPFACLYTSASSAKAFVPIAAPRRAAPFRTPQVLFTVGIEWQKGSLPKPPDRTSSLRDRDFRFCSVECPRLFCRSSSPEADCLQARFAFGSTDAPWSYPQLLRRSAPSTSLSKRFLRLVRPRDTTVGCPLRAQLPVSVGGAYRFASLFPVCRSRPGSVVAVSGRRCGSRTSYANSWGNPHSPSKKRRARHQRSAGENRTPLAESRLHPRKGFISLNI